MSMRNIASYDITLEEEETLLYSPLHNSDDICQQEYINYKIMIEDGGRDEDDDVVEVPINPEVIDIDDEESNPDFPISQTKTENSQSVFSNGNSDGFSAESTLETPPSTPLSFRDIKDTDLPYNDEDIAQNIKSQEILSSVPTAMVVIPSPAKQEDLDDIMSSLQEEFDRSLIHYMNRKTSSTLLMADKISSTVKSTQPCRPAEASQSIQLLPTCSTEKDPLKRPSILLKDDSCPEEATPLPNIHTTLPTPSAIRTNVFDCHKQYQFYYEKCSVKQQMNLDKIRLTRQKIMRILDKYSNVKVTKPETLKTNANKETINDQSTKVNNETEMSEKPGSENLNTDENSVIKYHFENATSMSNTNMAIVIENLKKCDTQISVAQKVDHTKPPKHDRFEKRVTTTNNTKKTTTVEQHNLNVLTADDSLSDMNSQTADNIIDPNNNHSEISIQCDMVTTPKQSCFLKKTTQKKKKCVTFDSKIEVLGINSGNDNCSKLDQVKSNLKRKLIYPIASPNQNMEKNTNINDYTPRCKSPRSDNHEYSSRTSTDREQSNTIVSNAYHTDNAIDHSMLKTSKHNKQDDLTKIMSTPQRNNMDKEITKHALDFLINKKDGRINSESSPSSISLTETENLNNNTYDDKKSPPISKPQLEVTLKMAFHYSNDMQSIELNPAFNTPNNMFYTDQCPTVGMPKNKQPHQAFHTHNNMPYPNQYPTTGIPKNTEIHKAFNTSDNMPHPNQYPTTDIPKNTEIHKALNTSDNIPYPNQYPTTGIPKITEIHKAFNTTDIMPFPNQYPTTGIPKNTEQHKVFNTTDNMPFPNQYPTTGIPKNTEIYQAFNTYNNISYPNQYLTTGIPKNSKHHQAFNASNSMLYPDHYSITGIPKYKPHPKGYQKPLHNPSIQRLMSTIENLQPTYYLPLQFLTKHPSNSKPPKYHPKPKSRSMKDVIEHNNIQKSFLEHFTGYPQGSSYYPNNNIQPSRYSSEVNNDNMTRNGAAVTARSHADGFWLSERDERRDNVSSSYFDYNCPPRLPSPPDYKKPF